MAVRVTTHAPGLTGRHHLPPGSAAAGHVPCRGRGICVQCPLHQSEEPGQARRRGEGVPSILHSRWMKFCELRPDRRRASGKKVHSKLQEVAGLATAFRPFLRPQRGEGVEKVGEGPLSVIPRWGGWEALQRRTAEMAVSSHHRNVLGPASGGGTGQRKTAWFKTKGSL